MSGGGGRVAKGRSLSNLGSLNGAGFLIGIVEGTTGADRYGPDPKGAEHEAVFA